MENVFTGVELSWAINATTVDESTPPERKAPNGTSDISLSLIDSRKIRVVSSIASSSVIFILREKSGFQYRCVSTLPSFHFSQCPGSSFLICLNAVCGAGTHKYER